jgi:hypothetical protein
MSGDDLARRTYAAARASADSARANAVQAVQVRDALIACSMEGAPIEDHEIAEASRAAQRALTEARQAEEQAEALYRTIPEPQQAPRPRVRVVSAIGALAWKERVLSMRPELAQARGLDPNRPPLTAREEV